jgi:hypothetical protein
LPYYYFQGEKLWPPIFWGAAFMIVNAIRIVAIALERRPVVLSDKEEELYRVAFSSTVARVGEGAMSDERDGADPGREGIISLAGYVTPSGRQSWHDEPR